MLIGYARVSTIEQVTLRVGIDRRKAVDRAPIRVMLQGSAWCGGHRRVGGRVGTGSAVVSRSGTASRQRADVRDSAPPGAAQPPRRTGGGTVLLPPWTRAPVRAFRQPAVLLAVVAAAAILTCASSSAALFLSSASSAALQTQAGQHCPDYGYPSVSVLGPAGVGTRLDPVARAGTAAAGLPAPYRIQQATATVEVLVGSQGQQQKVERWPRGRLWYGDGALRNITPIASQPGRGVWLPQDAATELSARPGLPVRPGDNLTLRPSGRAFRVVGIYRDLYKEPVRPYWCGYTNLFLNLANANTPPPAMLLVTDPDTMSAMMSATGAPAGGPVPLVASWVSPLDTAHLTVSGARTAIAAQQRAAAAVRARYPIDNVTSRVDVNGNLTDFADQADRIRDGLRGPVLPIALGGSLLALLLVGAAGSYWADRRFREVRLLASRGVGPGGLAALAALELALPAVLGAALGLGLAAWLVRTFGPAPELDGWAPRLAALTSVAALAAGIALLAAVAGVRASNTVERRGSGRRSWAAKVPWELAVLAAAALAYQRLRHGDAVAVDHQVAQVNLLLVAFPLLFLAGAATLLVRLLTLALPLLRRTSDRWVPALYLAARRVTSAPLVSATVLAAVSLPIGLLAYSGAITQTTAYTLHAKARVLTGGVASVSSTALPGSTAALARVSTMVLRYPDARLAGRTQVTVLAVDPDGFARYAFWDDRFADRPLPALLADIRAHPGAQHGAQPGAGQLTAVAMGVPTGTYPLRVGKRELPVRVAAVASVLPGRRAVDPVLLVDAAALGPVDSTAERFTELWTDDPQATQEAMLGQGMTVFNVSTDAKVRDAANLLGVTWAFGYLEALAALVGLVAVGGLLLYLETRQRQRVASYALARRMGLSGRAHLGSLLAELAALVGAAFAAGTGLAAVAVLAVYHRLDLDRIRPPAPLLSLPLQAMAWTGVAAAAVAVLAAGYAHHAAGRADTAEVMRLGPG
jgi:putative ABC transport system permease protein